MYAFVAGTALAWPQDILVPAQACVRLQPGLHHVATNKS